MKKLAVILVVLAMAGLAQAAVVFSETFDDLGEGSLLSADAAWTTGWPGQSLTVNAASGKSGKGATHTGGAESADEHSFTAVTAADALPIFRISMDAYIGTSAESVTQQDIRILVSEATPWAGNDHLSMLLTEAPSGTINVRLAFGTVDETAHAAFTAATVFDTWVNIWLELNLATGALSAGFDDGTAGSATFTDTWTLIDFAPASAAVYTAFVGSGAGTTRVDNILIEAIPEPATLAVLGIGGILALLRRRR